MHANAEFQSPNVPNGSDSPILKQTLKYAEDLRRTRKSFPVLQPRGTRGTRRRLQRPKILIVDDQWTVRLLVSATLDSERYHLLEAGTGTEALLLARATRPAVILLDVRMPDVDGVEVCRRIRADPSLWNVPVVMLTSANDEAERAAGMAAGATVYLTKPFSPLELLDTIEKLLDA